MKSYIRQSDSAILALIDQMSGEELNEFGNYKVQDLAHYLSLQRPWLETQAYYLGIQLGRPPTQGEVAQDVLQSGNCVRFRAFYVLRHPDLVTPNYCHIEDPCCLASG